MTSVISFDNSIKYIVSIKSISTLASFNCNIESNKSNEDIESLPILPDDILYGKIFSLLDFDQLAQCASLNKKMNELLQKKKNLIPSVSPNDNLMKAILNSKDGKLRLLPGQHKLEIDSNICIPKLYLFGSLSNVNKTSILLNYNNNKFIRMRENIINFNINKLVINSIIIETLSDIHYSLIISNCFNIDDYNYFDTLANVANSKKKYIYIFKPSSSVLFNLRWFYSVTIEI